MRCSAVLLAAGSASRMGHRPKCLLERDGQALIETQDITDLLQAFADRPSNNDLVFPQVQGQPGNPVALSAEVRDAVLQANDDFGCQTWRQHNRALVHAWRSDNLHYITDLDSQADIAALRQSLGIDLRWPQASAG